MPAPDDIVIQKASADAIRPLRHVVLRGGLPPEAAIFDGDDEPSTHHAAAIDGTGRIVGCATLVRRPWNNEPGWQLRGMAVDPAFQGRRVGHRLLHYLEQLVRQESHPHLLWCNARTPATGFYQRNGWAIASEQFHIETAGPHYQMLKRI